MLMQICPRRTGRFIDKVELGYKKEIIIEVVGSAFESLWYHSYIGKIVAPYYELKMKKRVRNSKNVIYVTEKFLQKKYPTKGNTESCSNILLNPNLINTKRKVNFNKPLIKFGIIGKVNLKYKGHKTVIDALAKLKKDGFINFTLEIVGSGDNSKLKKYLVGKDLVENTVFLSSLQHNMVLSWLSNIDIYIQPSFTEGLPRSTIEAMASGCVVIGSNAGGIPELLDEKMIFKKGKSKELYKIICSILEEKFSLDDLISNNILVSRKFYKDNIELKRFNFIKNVINKM